MTANDNKLVLDEEEDEVIYIVHWRLKNLHGEDVYYQRGFAEFGEAFECFHWKSIIGCVQWVKLIDPVGNGIYEFRREIEQ